MIVNNLTINEKYFYRIINNFEGSKNGTGQDCFWYVISSNKKDLHSCCINEKEATIYTGAEIIENATLIREFKNAKLIQV